MQIMTTGSALPKGQDSNIKTMVHFISLKTQNNGGRQVLSDAIWRRHRDVTGCGSRANRGPASELDPGSS